jgi:hypothetical protein
MAVAHQFATYIEFMKTYMADKSGLVPLAVPNRMPVRDVDREAIRFGPGDDCQSYRDLAAHEPAYTFASVGIAVPSHALLYAGAGRRITSFVMPFANQDGWSSFGSREVIRSYAEAYRTAEGNEHLRRVGFDVQIPPTVCEACCTLHAH